MIENNEIITTDTEGIYMRDFADTQVPRAFGYDNRTFTMNVYQYAHNPMELYEANTNQPAIIELKVIVWLNTLIHLLSILSN